ncbi:DUF5615 family PIN-like protein [Chitinimonas koreensis]|uniref:DUF5615 family PIN-like protein n=1 Tax=Chitinimonas koreensis TaxID=356302 RepID=UPI000412A4AE|nr:DUF5615 family PIN-like protein [Chitinimonas koreensis]QNM97810.1 DUF5615 family PIN-like protein [Chitinimonas koreensis]
MILWLDAQLPPVLAAWLTETFGLSAYALRDLGLRDATDLEIFAEARQAGAILLSKDSDFADLVTRLGPPPQLLWLTCGNTSNRSLCSLLSATLGEALSLLEQGMPIVEIDGRESSP